MSRSNSSNNSTVPLDLIAERADVRPAEIAAAIPRWKAIRKALRVITKRSDDTPIPDGRGFSRCHTQLGPALARKRRPTPALMALGRRWVYRYRNQIRVPLLGEALGDTSLADVKQALKR